MTGERHVPFAVPIGKSKRTMLDQLHIMVLVRSLLVENAIEANTARLLRSGWTELANHLGLRIGIVGGPSVTIIMAERIGLPS